MPSSDTTPPQPSHYDLLGVSSSASEGDLRRAFRGLSKRYHPDTTSLPEAQAAEAFRRLKQAYAVLSDPGERRRYDAFLGQALAVTPPSGGSGPTSFPSASATSAGAAAGRPVGVRRALSGGEWFALLLLGLALALSLVLGLGVAWARGMELVRSPSWWSETQPIAPSSSPSAAAGPAVPASPQLLAADALPAP